MINGTNQPHKKITRIRTHSNVAARQSWTRLIGAVFGGLLLLLTLHVFWITPAQALRGEADVSTPADSASTVGPEIGEMPNPLAPDSIILAQVGATTTLQVEIVGSPWATLDSNSPAGGIDVPHAFVIEAAVTNTGSNAANGIVITLDYENLPSWFLLAGEDEVRLVDTLAPGETYHAYWFASYPSVINQNHQYTVTAEANNADTVFTSTNIHEALGGNTVRTEGTLSTGSSGVVQTDADIRVGSSFEMTVKYNMGTKPTRAIFSPVGNLNFDPGAYRLLGVHVEMYMTDTVRLGDLVIADDRLYFPSIPPADNATPAVEAEAIYTFVALTTDETELCPYATVSNNSNPKYDQFYCEENRGTVIPVSGTLTISLSKEADKVTVQQGELLKYTLTVTNDGDLPLDFARLWDDIDTDLVSIDTGSISPASDPINTTDSRVTWNLAPMAPGEVQVFNFSVLVDGDGQDIPNGTSLVNHANFGAVLDHAVLTDSVTTNIQAPALTISKTDGQATVNPGGLLTYSIRITNSGSAAATGLVLTDVLPPNVSLAGTTNPSNVVVNGQTLSWNLAGSIAGGGGTRQVTIPVRVDGDLSVDGTILTNEATIQYQTGAGHILPTQSATDMTTLDVPTTTLAISKSAADVDGPPLVVGDAVQYTVKVTNTGAFTAYNVTVTDDLPDGVTFVNASADQGTPTENSGEVTWVIPTLAAAPGSNVATLLIDVTINLDQGGAVIVNTAGVTGTNVPAPPGDTPPVCPDGASTPCDPDHTPVPETTLDITKTATDVDGPPVEINDTILYELQVTNTGAFTAYNVTVTDDLHDGVTFVDASADQGTPSESGGIVTWTIPELAAAGSDVATMLITVTINSDQTGQTITNTGSVTASNVLNPPDDPDPVCPDGTLEPCDPIQGLPALVLNKTAEDLNGPPTVVSDTIRYTLQVTNTGTYTAFNVTVTDDLPDEVECLTVSGDHFAGDCADPLIWSIPSLDPNESAMLEIDVFIPPAAEGATIVNSASVTATNVVSPPTNPDPVCPDGSSEPCDPIGPPGAPDDGGIYLPAIMKNLAN